MTRSIEPIRPINPDGILRIYCCGPTVYNYAHIGNFRTFLIQDVLHRLLLFCGYSVRFVRNITDVDDKTIRNSQKEGISLKNFTTKWTDIFHHDIDQLNILPPDVEPLATEHIAEQIALIERLVVTHHAYVTSDGSVYFRLQSFPHYGKLSGMFLENLHSQDVNSAGERNNADEYTRDSVQDFALWKGRKPEDGDVFWQSPWGKGRPGWHIECSAMSMKYLGEQIDIHCGGIDLCFPHHENEIAQTESVTGKNFAQHWFHSAHLQVDGQKMSKSLGNLFTLKDLEHKGYSPEVIRYSLIAGHYRQPLNFTFTALDAAHSALNKLKQKVLDWGCEIKNFDHNKQIEWKYFHEAFQALIYDLNVPKCLGEIFKVVKLISVDEIEKAQMNLELSALCYILGISEKFFQRDSGFDIIPDEIQLLAEKRWQCKLNRDFSKADEYRQFLLAKGWLVLDQKDSFSLQKK